MLPNQLGFAKTRWADAPVFFKYTVQMAFICK